MGKRIVLADPRGFCAGVDRAILTVRTILKSADTPRADGLPPVYVRRQIVHNKHVVEDLAAQGAVFVQELAEIPDANPRPRCCPREVLMITTPSFILAMFSAEIRAPPSTAGAWTEMKSD